MTTVKVGPKGQVVIPKAVREEVGIRPGDEVAVDAVDGEARVRRRVGATGLLGLLADPRGPQGMGEFEAEKRRERELEERKEGRLAGRQANPGRRE